jgi:hypothetical protein
VAAGGAVVIAALLIGRLSVDTGSARTAGYQAGYQAGHEAGHSTGYAAGVRDGAAQGRREGRALQQPATAGTAFTKGYVAGATDVFAGYDGGWPLSDPYVITLGPGADGITYRITSREAIRPGVAYFRCPGSTALCQEPHR